MDVRNYRVYVEPLRAHLGGGFVAYAPELKGCISDGETPEEALRNIYDAIACWIDAAHEAGQPIPPAEALKLYA
jgi:predicted RNase H-like HicB family nuclease